MEFFSFFSRLQRELCFSVGAMQIQLVVFSDDFCSHVALFLTILSVNNCMNIGCAEIERVQYVNSRCWLVLCSYWCLELSFK
jgi:hypothetical protein